MALTKAKLIELIDNGDIEVGISNPMPDDTLIVNLNADKLDGSHLADILLAIYPVGAIYMSYVSTSPATLFGGTWSALEGKFLIGADGTYTAGSTGGSSTSTFTLNSYAHAQIMSNNTYGIVLNYIGATDWNANRTVAGAEGSTAVANNYNATKVIGTTENKSIIPPYIAVYMWERTA